MEHVDAVVGIARMHEHLVVLFEPGVHLVPVERHVILQIGARRLQVTPGCFLGDAVTDLHGEEAGLAFPGMVAGVTRRDKQVELHVLHREVIDGEAPVLEHEHDGARIGNGRAAQQHADTTPGGFEKDAVSGRPAL
jgi:hypothetical protein